MAKELDKEARVLTVSRAARIPAALENRVSQETRKIMKAYPILLLDKDLTSEEIHKQLQMFVIRLEGNDSFIFVEHRPKFRAWIVSENVPVRVYKAFFLDMIRKAVTNTFGEDKQPCVTK